MFVFNYMYLRKKTFSCKGVVIPDAETRVRTLLPAPAHCAGRANSPSVSEGVAVGRGSNIGIIIPFFIILMLVILNNVFPQIRKHDVHMLQHVKICRVEDFQPESLQIFVPLCVIASLPNAISAMLPALRFLRA